MIEENQGLTRREVLKRGAVVGGTLLWAAPAIQTIGMSAALADTPSICSEQWADSVDSFSQGLRSDGSAVPAARSNPNSALGPTDGNFFSLGFGGQITVKFASPAFRTAGAFVVVVETTGGTYPLEKAEVSVSADGATFHLAGEARNDGSGGISNLTIPGSLNAVQWVKIVDTTNAALFTGAPGDGFDVNSVQIRCDGN